jgi:hypothetical protein
LDDEDDEDINTAAEELIELPVDSPIVKKSRPISAMKGITVTTSTMGCLGENYVNTCLLHKFVIYHVIYIIYRIYIPKM